MNTQTRIPLPNTNPTETAQWMDEESDRWLARGDIIRAAECECEARRLRKLSGTARGIHVAIDNMDPVYMENSTAHGVPDLTNDALGDWLAVDALITQKFALGDRQAAHKLIAVRAWRERRCNKLIRCGLLTLDEVRRRCGQDALTA